ncbi:MAG: inositol monophosphatase family protein [Nitrospinota bacterium]
MKRRRKVVVQIIREAGGKLAENFGRPQHVEYKGAVDLVTAMDRASEDHILSRLKAAFPEDDILTEERDQEVRRSENLWIVDPLDATNNYAHGFPMFCVSIAFERLGRVVLGAIYDPLRDEMFLAEAGEGAALNGMALTASSTPHLDVSLVATGFPYDKRESPVNNLDHFQRFALRTQGVRRTGSAALDLAYVAMGRLDGFWELKLSPWDVAAGALLVQEAGGRVTDFAGGGDFIYGGEVVASNGRIHQEMLVTLSEGSDGKRSRG